MQRIIRIFVWSAALLLGVVFRGSAQPVIIGSVDPGPYGSGSNITVPVIVKDALKRGSRFELYLSDNTGAFISVGPIGFFDSHFTTFVNGVIPANTPSGNYKLKLRVINGTLEEYTIPCSTPITIDNKTGPSIVVTPTETSKVLIPDKIWGFCSQIKDNNALLIRNQSTSGAVVTGTLRNDYLPTDPLVNIDFGLSPLSSLNLKVAYYTATFKAIKDGIVSTKSYVVLNSTYNLSLQSNGSQNACIPALSNGSNSYGESELISYSVNIGASSADNKGSVLTNYPGLVYGFDWGDGPADYVTQAELTAASGNVTHRYNETSCGQAPIVLLNTTIYNSYKANIFIEAPFCTGASVPITTYPKVFKAPVADFDVAGGRGCVNKEIAFENTTIPGQSEDASGTSCTNETSYVWYIKKSTDPESAWVPLSIDQQFKHKFTSTGTYNIKLIASNNSCPPSEKVKDICIEDSPILDYSFTRSSVCGPTDLTVTNHTPTGTLCAINYSWQVLDSVSLSPVTDGVTFLTADNIASPKIRVTTPGSYILRLTTLSACDTLSLDKPFVIAGPLTVNLPENKKICRQLPLVLDFKNDDFHKPVYTGFGANKAYHWDIVGGAPEDYSFESGNASSAFPSIKFIKPGEYKVSITYTNECGIPVSDTQIITFYGPTIKDAGPDAIICDNDAPNSINTSYQLHANQPFSYETGMWSVVSAPTGSVFSDPSKYDAVISKLVPGVYKLRWTISNPGGCAESDDMMLTVYEKPEGGSISGDQNVCIGGSGTLTATGMVGKILQWESSIDNSTWTPIANTNSTYDYSNLLQKTYFRVKVGSSGPLSDCHTEVYSSVFDVTPDPLSIGGTATGGGSFCELAPSGQISLSGNNGVIKGWERSIDNGQTWIPISSVANPYSFANVKRTTLFRAVVQSGSCSVAKSDPALVQIISKPTVSSAGANAVLCINNGQYQLNGNSPVSGTGVWSETAGPSVIFNDPARNDAIVSGLQKGQHYEFTWTISNGVCDPSTSATTLDLLSDIQNSIKADRIVSCKNNEVNLSSDILTGGDVAGFVTPQYHFLWESSPDGIGSWSAVPGGTTEAFTVYPAATTWYRRTVWSRGSCESVSDPLKITINASTPSATAGSDVILCNATSYQLAGNDPGSGFSGSWRDVASGSILSFIPDNHTYNAQVQGLVPGRSYQLEWSIAGISPCPDTKSIVNITVRKPVTTASAGPDQQICIDKDNSNNQTILTGNAPDPANGETGKWTKVSGPGVIIADPGKYNSQLSGLTAGIYVFEWKINSDATIADPGCKESSKQLTVKVTAFPKQGVIDGGNISVCQGSNAGQLSLANYSPLDLLQWQSSSDNVTYADIPGATADKLQPGVMLASKWFRVKITQADACGVSITTVPVKIQVDEPTLAGTATGSVARVCTGENTGSISLKDQRGAIVRWEQSTDNGAHWSNISSSGNPYVFNDLQEDTWFRAIVKNGSCDEQPSTVAFVQVLPNVTKANAGSDRFLCNELEVNLDGNVALKGAGTWSQVSGPVTTISDPSNPKTKITGLSPGTYVFRWSISNEICDPSTDDVIIYNYPPLLNQITGSNTVCSGQTVHIASQLTGGGNSNYSYQWESSTDNINWTLLPGQYQDDYTSTFTSSAYIRRIITSGPCSGVSNSVYVQVQPPISNNTIIGDQVLCAGQTSGIVIGSSPAGGDGTYYYKWQRSTDNTLWEDISGATSIQFDPGILPVTTSFRRIVSTALCDGDQKNVSNSVKIVVNPLAKADFTASVTKTCTPFDLKQVISLVPYDDRNAEYEWYADGVSIGTGKDFPGYTILNDGESVTIRLIARSKFGCSSDTKEAIFSTVKDVKASFVKDQVKGCGPLAVNFTNTSAPLSGGNYLWDFGNGQTSTEEQPGTIVFEPHPLHRDTTYIIKLKASTGCKDTWFVDSVLVRPKPRVTFSPDRTWGCSPLEITFTNQSAGTPNTYSFDFGDGTTLVKSDNSAVSHTFYTTKTDTVTVRLKAENECGTDTASYNIVVYPNTVTSQLVVNGDKKYGCAPFTVRFDNNSEGANRFYWDFKDGTLATTTSAPESLTHTFTAPGTYTVSLLATNGCSSGTDTETITVYGIPDASFTVAGTQYCEKVPVQFTSKPLESASYSWNFDDGSTSGDANPQHVFTHPGKYQVTLTVLQSHPDGSVCSNMSTTTIEILPLPVALFTTNEGAVNCAPFKLVVSTTPANAAYVEWDFGDIQSDDNRSSGYITEHVFRAPGLYKVKEIAYNEAGCIDTIVKYIKVSPRPKAAFAVPDSLICGTGATLSFVNQSDYTGTDAVTYCWLINNVQVSALKNLNYTFSAPAAGPMPYKYEVKLIAQSTMGCPDTVKHTIQFNPLPSAVFETKANISCPPFKVEISNNSKYADRFAWYLDDVLVSEEREPKNIVLNDADKSYKLRLVTSNLYGCAPATVEKTLSTYPKPIAAFTLAESVSCTGVLDIKVTNTSKGALRYSWDFGDGSPASNDITPSHAYGKPGVFNLRLVAYGTFCTDTLIQQIKIAGIPTPVFAADVTKGCTQMTVNFQNTSENASTYLWDFGDGTFSTSKNPVHTFTYIQSPYTVKLTAYGEFGCSNEAVLPNYIQVVAPPATSFEILPDSVIKIPDYTFNFRNTSTGNPVKYKWFFGDGKSSDEENPSHTYINTGSYNVLLISTNADGCQNAYTKTVRIDGVPGYLYVPSGFEPGSLKPELKTFIPKGSGIARYSLKIFNKWGQLIWKTDKLDENGSPVEGWDGTIEGRPAEQGVYVWDISATFIDGGEWKGMKYEKGSRTTVGPIHLIR